MPRQKRIFENNNYYHIFNRGVDKRKIFLDEGDLRYFLDTMIISNSIYTLATDQRYRKRKELKKEAKNKNEKLVSIVAYSLLPNHFHLILKQEVENGISKFMQKLGTSYSVYFNKKYKRSGTLFQGKFKSSGLSDKDSHEFSLEVTSVYVNLNYKHHNYDLKKDLIKTSVFEYLYQEKGEPICDLFEIEKIINSIGGLEEYKKYLKNKSQYFIERHNNDNKGIKFDDIE